MDSNLQQKFRELFSRHEQTFARSNIDLGCCTIGTHHSNTGEAPPVKQRGYRHSRPDNDFIGESLDELAKHGIIEPCESAWASPVVVVEKKEEGARRLCVDQRRVNDVTVTDSYPMPNAEALVDDLENAAIFSTLDMLSGFYQIPMDPADRDKTAFITKQGLFRFTRMPFGLKNAPATYQRVMETVLAGLPFAKCYIDDILVYSPDMETHLKHLDIVLTRLHDVNMKVKAKKCHFALAEVKYLGHIVTQKGVKPDPENVAAIKDMKQPNNVTEVRAFLGTTGFYRRFIKGYAAIAKPLTDLTRNDVGSVPDSWTPECTAAFENLRRALMEEPVLTRPNLDKPFILTTDWQPNSIAGILSQMSDDGVEQVIAYGSKKLSGAEANWSATEGECWAVVYFTKRWKHFLLGSKFTLVTDHAALKYIMTATDTSHKWQRWALKIRGYDFEVKHRAGKENTNADGLSRLQYHTTDKAD